jgi:hypothetical protein
MAVLCEKVLEDRDGVLSVIRIVDGVTRSAVGPEAPDQMPPFVSDDLTMVISLKSEQAKGRFGIKVRPEAPGGMQLPPVEQAINLSPGGGGVNIVMPMVLPLNEEGVYWFDVFLTQPRGGAEQLLTRVPLEVQYLPQRPAS